MKKILVYLCFSFIFYLSHKALGQEPDKYFLGEERKLQIVVYIIGEVNKPGEYRVTDNTNVVELISKSGGTTQFSNITSVTITRYTYPPSTQLGDSSSVNPPSKQIIKFNMKEYLNSTKSDPPPILKPGDIVYVSKNKWYTWRTIAAVLRDLAVVASAYFLYRRAVKD